MKQGTFVTICNTLNTLLLFSLLSFFMYATITKKKELCNDLDKYSSYTYSDIDNGGVSKLDSFVHDSTGISYSYSIQPGAPWLFAGFCIQDVDLNTFSLQNYDSITVRFKEPIIENVVLYLRLFIKGYTINESPTTALYKRAILEPEANRLQYQFAISELVTPEWWFYENHLTDIKTSLREVHGISLEYNIASGEEPQFVEVESISANRDLVKLLSILIFIGITSQLLRIVIMKIVCKKNVLDLQYQKVTVSNNSEDDTVILVTSINNRFTDHRLTKKEIAFECGISKDRITKILQDDYDQSFREYLNELRITKAKELLKSSDLSITRISFEVGYTYPSSFSRIFRELNGVTPAKFRKNTQR